jgi:deoxyribose-phosphate aldolase
VSGLSIAKSLELQLLRPTLTPADVVTACERAATLHLAAVVVPPVHVREAARVLDGTDTRLIAVVGHPFGQELVPTRLAAAERARAAGADDIAVPVNHSLVLAADVAAVQREIGAMLESSAWASLVSSRGHGHLTLILETMRCDLDLFAPVWELLHDSSCGFVQTSSGVLGDVVGEDHIKGVRGVLPPDVQVKASGGVATLVDAESLLNGGAVRVCSHSAIAIAEEERELRAARAAQ